MSTLTPLTIALHFLMIHEGLRLNEYLDSTGYRTIGYGWNIDAHKLPAEIGKVVNGKVQIERHEADYLLNFALRKHWDDLIIALPWVASLVPARQAVLLDMSYNMGVPALLAFKNTLSLIRSGDYEGASRLMLKSKWSKQVGNRAKVLSEAMRKGSISDDVVKSYGMRSAWEHY